LPIINKTKSPTKGANKVQDGRTSFGKLRMLQRGQITIGMKINQVLKPSPPSIVKIILNKERGGTLERMPSLDEPSPIITIHSKINVAYTPYNATDTLYM